jgi:serine/threonine protein kinase
MDNDGGGHGLWLEKAEYDTIRAILQGKVPLPDKVLKDPRTRWRWIFQLISGLAHLHAHSFVHCDISCRNIVVTSSLDAKLIDFGGSATLGADGLVAEEARYSCPSTIRETKLPSFRTDIFALGSAMYEILTDSPPYSDVSSDEAESRFKDLQFPETVNLRAGNVILDCWTGKFQTVKEVEQELDMVPHLMTGTLLMVGNERRRRNAPNPRKKFI